MGDNVSFHFSTAHDDISRNVPPDDSVFSNDQGIIRMHFPFEAAIYPHRSFESGCAFEIDTLSQKGIMLVIKNGLTFLGLLTPPEVLLPLFVLEIRW